MRGQSSTEPEISAGENAEDSFVHDLCLRFRGGTSAWLGTAAELLAELKARAGLERGCWPENPQILCSQLERDTELLRSCGLEVHIKQQDNGPRLISIRSQGGSHGPSLQAEPDSMSAASSVVETNGLEEANGGQSAKESNSNEGQAFVEPAASPLNGKPSIDQASNHKLQGERSADFSDPTDWHDIRKSLSGYDTANSVPTGIGHRILITCTIILSVFSVLALFAWLWPASFPTTLFARNTERQSNSAGSRQNAEQATSAKDKTNQQLVTPTVSHGELVTSGAENRGAGQGMPEEVPKLLDHSRSGDANAQYLLGRAYETGTGVEQDFVNAYAWYVIADASGNPKGKDAAKQLTPKLGPLEIASVRSKVGSIYASGAYVPRDYTKAYVWFSLAAAAGDPQGEQEKTVLARKMTEQEIAEANNRASDWLKKHGKQIR